MNTATTQRLQIVVPGALLQFCDHMDKIKKYLDEHTQKLDRALQFVVRQYENSPLAKQRKAKTNLTAACNHALATLRKTLRQLIAIFIEYTTTPSLQLRELLSEQHQANAPNRCTVKTFASLRQAIQTTKAGNPPRI